MEQLYEKYKDRGGKMAPEIRLLFMIIMSAVTFHLSQTLFGPGGMKDAINNNPNIINQMLKGLMGGQDKSNSGEPIEARSAPPNSKAVLDLLKKKRQSNTQTDTHTATATTETNKSQSKHHEISQKELELDRERKMVADQKKQLEIESKRREDMYNIQMEKMKQHHAQITKQSQHDQQVRQSQHEQQLRQMRHDQQTRQQNLIQNNRSDHTQKTQSLEEINLFENIGSNLGTDLGSNIDLDIGPDFGSDLGSDFGSDLGPDPKINSRRKKASTNRTHSEKSDGWLESLDESSEIDITDIYKSNDNKHNSKKHKRSPINSAKRHSANSASDGLSTISRKNKASVMKL